MGYREWHKDRLPFLGWPWDRVCLSNFHSPWFSDTIKGSFILLGHEHVNGVWLGCL